MKKIILLLIGLTMFSFNNNGQTWHSYPTSNSVWNYYCMDPGGSYLFFQEIIGDTTLNNQNYIKLKVNESLHSIINYHYVREENKIIYQYNPYDTSEFIIFNFNIFLGATFYSPYCQDSLTVNSIDSILLENGEYRKRIDLSNGNLYDIWVEGIGSLKFPIGFGWQWETGGNINCLYQNLEYLISTHCSYIGIKENKYSENNIIYPNPTSGILYVKLPNEDQVERIEIYNVLGKLIDITSSNKSIDNINISNLPNGIYIIKLISTDMTIQSKIIKE